MSFKTWIEQFGKIDHPFSDLAKAVYTDIDFPGDESYDKIMKHIDQQIECDNKMEIFEKAWQEYSNKDK